MLLLLVQNNALDSVHTPNLVGEGVWTFIYSLLVNVVTVFSDLRGNSDR